jgi:hypothetical protein
MKNKLTNLTTGEKSMNDQNTPQEYDNNDQSTPQGQNSAMDIEAWLAMFGRITEITGARTQVELAGILDIRQSSISDAKRRGSMPSDWGLTLLEKYGVNPRWIRTGEGGKYLLASDSPGKLILDGELEAMREQIRAELVADPSMFSYEEARAILTSHYPAGARIRLSVEDSVLVAGETTPARTGAGVQ